MRNLFISGIAALLVLVGGSVFYLAKPTDGNRTHIVLIRESGFAPAELTAKTGDVVEFRNAASRDAWPASDPHPTHEFLPVFDPGQAIPPSGRWRFTLPEGGVWTYHDHLSVSLRGQINVLANKEIAQLSQRSAAGDYCGGKCFDDLVRDTVREKGIDAAYALFSEAFASGKLPRQCHWTAHQIGEEAYHLFREGKDFPISHATSYCGYGFYHGFLEGLLRENPDINAALALCDRVKEQLGQMGLWNCYHGIGHGFTEDPPDPRTWGSFDKMLAPGIEICERIFGDNFQNLNLCLTGVYTVPAGFADKGEYGLSIDSQDPFAFCRTQPYRYQKACYGEITPKIERFLEEDLSRLLPYLASINDGKIKRLVVWVAPSVMMARDIMNADFSNYIRGCQENFESSFRDICLGGTILGFMTHGEPEKQYVKLLEFCAADGFAADARDLCYKESLRQMRRQYPEEKMKQICVLAPEQYRRFCFDDTIPSPYNDPVFD